MLASAHRLGNAELVLLVVGQLPVPAEVVLLRFELSQLLLEHEHSEQGDSRMCCQVEFLLLALCAALALEAVRERVEGVASGDR